MGGKPNPGTPADRRLKENRDQPAVPAKPAKKAAPTKAGKWRVPEQPVMPSAVTAHVSWFDRFAAAVTGVVSRAWFFTACVVMIAVWSPTLLVMDVNTSQLIINTVTSLLTTLLVALLQNSQQRADQATQHKLNALAAGVAALMEAYATDPATPDRAETDLGDAIAELSAAVGLERRESS